MVQVVGGRGKWGGGHTFRRFGGGGGGSTRLRWGRRLTMTSKLGLEGCNLCCQLVDMLFSGHAEALRVFEVEAFFYCQGASKTGSILDIQVPAELQQIYKGSLKGHMSWLND